MVTNFACVWSNFSITLNFYHFGRKLMKSCSLRPSELLFKKCLSAENDFYNLTFITPKILFFHHVSPSNASLSRIPFLFGIGRQRQKLNREQL